MTFLVAVVLGTLGLSLTNQPSQDRVEIEQTDEALIVRVDGQEFCQYRYAFDPRPIVYPINTPSGESVTRRWPMDEAPDEAHDHPHHQSLWFAHGNVNGHDFWHPGENQRRIAHDGFIEISDGDDQAVVVSKNRWLAADGEEICTERRTMIFRGDHETRTIDFEFVITPSGSDLLFADTKEGTMAMRLTPTLRLSGPVAQGEVQNSEGVTGKDTWGKRAAWVAYSGPIGDEQVTVAMFDHRQNPRHPTWWHARDYGLFAANPFGVHDFEGKPAGTGDFIVSTDETLTLRYRVLIASGMLGADELAVEFDEYAVQDR